MTQEEELYEKALEHVAHFGVVPKAVALDMLAQERVMIAGECMRLMTTCHGVATLADQLKTKHTLSAELLKAIQIIQAIPENEYEQTMQRVRSGDTRVLRTAGANRP